MDAQVLTTLINNVGFPIATFFVCAFYINKQSDTHREEISNITEALNNNTLAITKLVDKLGGVNNENNKSDV